MRISELLDKLSLFFEDGEIRNDQFKNAKDAFYSLKSMLTKQEIISTVKRKLIRNESNFVIETTEAFPLTRSGLAEAVSAMAPKFYIVNHTIETGKMDLHGPFSTDEFHVATTHIFDKNDNLLVLEMNGLDLEEYDV